MAGSEVPNEISRPETFPSYTPNKNKFPFRLILAVSVAGFGVLLIRERKINEGLGLILLAAVYGWASAPW